jgi:hypothetical protein
MADQTQDSELLEYDVWIPKATPTGQSVTVKSGERAGRHLMHAETPDQSEFYFEVLAYEGHLDHAALAADQKRFLADHSPDGHTSDPRRESMHHLEGTTFEFRGTLQDRWKERKFLFVDGPNRTYRVVHDPRSDLNVQALRSLQLRGDGGA